MSLLSSIILPKLEAELVAMEPALAAAILGLLKKVAAEVMAWIESKGTVAAAANPNDIPK